MIFFWSVTSGMKEIRHKDSVFWHKHFLLCRSDTQPRLPGLSISSSYTRPYPTIPLPPARSIYYNLQSITWIRTILLYCCFIHFPCFHLVCLYTLVHLCDQELAYSAVLQWENLATRRCSYLKVTRSYKLSVLPLACKKISLVVGSSPACRTFDRCRTLKIIWTSSHRTRSALMT